MCLMFLSDQQYSCADSWASNIELVFFKRYEWLEQQWLSLWGLGSSTKGWLVKVTVQAGSWRGGSSLPRYCRGGDSLKTWCFALGGRGFAGLGSSGFSKLPVGLSESSESTQFFRFSEFAVFSYLKEYFHLSVAGWLDLGNKTTGQVFL